MRSKLLITGLIIMLLVAYAYLGIDYVQQRREHEALISQITDTRQILMQMSRPPQDLERQLETSQLSLAAEQNAFPAEISSTQVINTILELADKIGIRAIPLMTEPWSEKNIGEHSYQVLRLNISLEGNFSQVVDFIDKLENEEPETLVIEGLSVTRLSSHSGDDINSGETIPVEATLDMAIYARTVTPD